MMKEPKHVIEDAILDNMTCYYNNPEGRDEAADAALADLAAAGYIIIRREDLQRLMHSHVDDLPEEMYQRLDQAAFGKKPEVES